MCFDHHSLSLSGSCTSALSGCIGPGGTEIDRDAAVIYKLGLLVSLENFSRWLSSYLDVGMAGGPGAEGTRRGSERGVVGSACFGW